MAKLVRLPNKYALPDGWIWGTLGELTNILSGFPFRSDLFSKESTTRNRPLIRIRDVVPSHTDTYTSEECSEEYIVKKGDILIGMDGDFNVNRWDSSDGVLNQRVCKISSTADGLDERYLFYYLPQPLKEINANTPSVTVKHLSTKTLTQTPIPLPPVETQRRIANLIEKEFRRLDEAKDQIQAVLDSSEERKQSILHKAFTGELTRKWRAVNNTRYEWGKVELITVLREKPRNGKSPKPVNYQTKVKSLTLSAVTSGIFNPKCYKYVDINIETDSYLWLKPGDVLIERSNSLEKVGTSALFTGEDHDFIYPDLMMKLQTNERILPEFLAYQLKLNSVMQYFRENATGTAGNMPKINQTTVSNAPILLPTIEEQKEIVRIIDQYMQKEIASSEVLNMTIDQIEETRTSVLSHAFHGELNL